MYSILFFIICALHVFGLKNDDKFSNDKSLPVGCAHELRALLSLSRMAKSNKMSNKYKVNQKENVPSKSNMVSCQMICLNFLLPSLYFQSIIMVLGYTFLAIGVLTIENIRRKIVSLDSQIANSRALIETLEEKINSNTALINSYTIGSEYGGG